MARPFSFRRTLSLLAGLGALLAAGRAEALSVALEAMPGTCVTQPGEVYAQLTTLLVARGHTVTTVSAAQIDTLAEINAYDVVVFGGGSFNCDWDWIGFDAVLPGYVQNGGGLVVTGWGLYYMADNTKAETYTGLETTLPMLKGIQYLTAGTVSATPGHPITQGVTSFSVSDYNNYGGGLRAGATPLITQGGTVTGAAWSYGAGRSVYLGPIYLANWGNYVNEDLLDGSQPQAQTLLLQAIEWAGAGGPVDTDGDGIVDPSDNCPAIANPTQMDTDADGQGDACDADDDNDGVLDAMDNCPQVINASQLDADADGQGDACDADDDNDGVLDAMDNCPLLMNASQLDSDGDGQGDACDADDDDDGLADAMDNCPLVVNPDQINNDNDALGDLCDPDDDNDGVLDVSDNCHFTANANQADNDGDGQGDACDPDDDNDGVLDVSDNCALVTNADQLDSDGNGQGDACDGDDDGDGLLDAMDNCPLVVNPDQLDTDGDGQGDACDADDDGDGNPDAGDPCPLDPDPCDGGGGAGGGGGGQGGAGGEAGAMGTGGDTGGGTGTGGAGPGGDDGGSGESGGCGCRMAGPSTHGGLVLGLGILLLSRRRRRRI